MSKWKFVWRFVPLMAIMVLLLSGCGIDTLSTLEPQGPVAQGQLDLMKLSLGVMLFVLVIVFGLYAYVLIRFRKRKGQVGVPVQVEGNHILEIIWTVVPIILLVIIAVPTVQKTFEDSADHTKDKDAIHVKVTAHQFWWQFEYPDYGITTAQDLVIPVGKKVSFEITSADVNHSFWVPSLAGKIDANPGMTNILYFIANKAALFNGKCAELCGFSHALMDFKVKSVSESEFTAWLDSKKAPAKATPVAAAKGEQIFKDNCLSCHAVSSGGAGFGPNLNGFADRSRVAGILPHDDKSLNEWITDPESVKPGAKMPKVPINQDQITEVIKYLNTLTLK
jgi:cytochrome c oxidase subunit 2